MHQPPFISHGKATWQGSHNQILGGRNRLPWLLTTCVCPVMILQVKQVKLQDTNKTWKLKILLKPQFPIHPLSLKPSIDDILRPCHSTLELPHRPRPQDTWQLVIRLLFLRSCRKIPETLKPSSWPRKTINSKTQQDHPFCLRMVIFSGLILFFLGWYC